MDNSTLINRQTLKKYRDSMSSAMFERRFRSFNFLQNISNYLSNIFRYQIWNFCKNPVLEMNSFAEINRQTLKKYRDSMFSAMFERRFRSFNFHQNISN